MKRLGQMHITRDSILFFAGLAGVFYETIFRSVERPSLLVVFAGMMGLPAFLRRDEKKGPKRDDDDDTDRERSPSAGT